MREIGCCQLGVYIPLWEFAEFPWWEDHLNKQTNKQTNKQQVSFNTVKLTEYITLKGVNTFKTRLKTYLFIPIGFFL